MLIKVTQDHINKGARIDPTGCPVALAALAAGSNYANVGTNAIYFKEGSCLPSLLPEEVRQFICDFDNNQEVQPFEFEIDEN